MSRTIGQILCWAQRRLTEARLEDAKIEARILVAHQLGTDRSVLLARAHDPAPAGLAAGLAPLLDRRAAREPLDYIIGSTEFFGLPIQVERGVLIPRSDSETLVRVALRHTPQAFSGHIADLGTGTGCLLVAILANRRQARGTAVEVDPRAVQLAGRNARLNAVDDRMAVLGAPWTDWTGWGAADVIVSNPPYIATPVLAGLDPQVRDHEPRLALDGGADGLDAYRSIIGLAAARCRRGTRLILEIGYDQAAEVTQHLETAGFSSVALTHDYGDNPRVLSAVKNSP